MTNKTPKYPYVLAIISSLPALIISGMGPIFISVFIVFLLIGSLFGFLWPHESWRWGLWIAGPLVVLLGLSVLFAGQWDVFLKNDLPVLLLSITAACSGSFVSAWYKKKSARKLKRN